MDKEYIDKKIQSDSLVRIANAIEEILRLAPNSIEEILRLKRTRKDLRNIWRTGRMTKDKYQTITDAAYVLNGSLNRIAVALEEVLRLVKEDQERSRKYMEERKDDFQDWKVIPRRVGKCSDPDRSLALAPGPRTKLQAASGKLQAPSGKLDKTTL